MLDELDVGWYFQLSYAEFSFRGAGQSSDIFCCTPLIEVIVSGSASARLSVLPTIRPPTYGSVWAWNGSLPVNVLLTTNVVVPSE